MLTLVCLLAVFAIGRVSAQQSVEVTLDSPYSGSIAANGTINVQFQTTAGEVYRFALSDRSSDEITPAGVYSSDGTTKKRAPNRDLVGDGSLVHVRVTSSEAGTFTLSVERLGVQEVGGEDLPGSTATRGLIEVGKKALYGNLDDGDQDWYKVVLDDYSRHFIRMGSAVTPPPDSDVGVTIFDARGNPLVTSDDIQVEQAGSKAVYLNSCNGGTFYVQVGNSTDAFYYFVEAHRIGDLHPWESGVSTGMGAVQLQWNSCWSGDDYDVQYREGATWHELDESLTAIDRPLGIEISTRQVGTRWQSDIAGLPRGNSEYRFRVLVSTDNFRDLTVEVPAENVGIANKPATGYPTISGTAQVGQTLKADTSGITDPDNDPDSLTGVTYNYQWMRDIWRVGLIEIEGETGSTYTLRSADRERVIKVRVIFWDEAGNYESLISRGTAIVTRPPQGGL